jgi:hypothetical protein
VKWSCISSSAIISRWSQHPSSVTLNAKVRRPTFAALSTFHLPSARCERPSRIGVAGLSLSHACPQGDEKLVQLLERLERPGLHPGGAGAVGSSFDGGRARPAASCRLFPRKCRFERGQTTAGGRLLDFQEARRRAQRARPPQRQHEPQIVPIQATAACETPRGRYLPAGRVAGFAARVRGRARSEGSHGG